MDGLRVPRVIGSLHREIRHIPWAAIRERIEQSSMDTLQE